MFKIHVDYPPVRMPLIIVKNSQKKNEIVSKYKKSLSNFMYAYFVGWFGSLPYLTNPIIICRITVTFL
ncbi:hypothetical protein C656_02540 [Enterococcus hirae 57-03-H11]|nr:hypothetical protein A6J73_02465 [Enterococcus hirae]OWW62729.1 hypothetical protein F521_10665 [Enterococcus hirae 67-03-C5]OWW68622.1 hypothetical protein C656_02540 [Enterococcus hirae 57-03-H11]HCU82058.1 hypothetical protein [Enterococcus sp.]OZS40146.1 hypothetical protein CHB54_09895 [Enterococcus hirae]